MVLPILNNNTTVSKKDKLPALFLMIMCDIQLLLGSVLYFKYSGYGISAFNNGVGAVMKNAELRKIAVEHVVLMLIALVLVHIGYSKVKKVMELDKLKRTSLIYFGIALVLILAGIPWNRLMA